MADSFIQLSPDSTGKRVDTRTAPDGDHREVNVIGSPTTAEVAEADLANGLDVDVTRVQGSVAVTNAGLTALLGAIAGTEVQVDIVSGGSAGVQYTEDDAAPVNPVGTALAMVRDDVLSGQTTADGDIVAARATDKGELYVKHVDAIPVTDNAGSLTVDNAALAVVGGGVEATALRVTLASDSTGLVSVDDNGGSLTVDNAALSVVGGGTEATAQRVTIANDSTGVVSVDDNGGSLTVDGTVAVSGAVDTELPAAAALADNTANPTAPAVGAFQELWDGATWDRAPGNSADGALVNLGANNDVSLNAGTNNIGDVDVLSVIPGTGATNLGKAVDSVPGATDTGVVPLAVRDDALATLTPADGDYTQLRTDSTGALWVRDTVGGGTQYAEDTAHSSGDLVTMAGVVQQTADSALSSDGDRSALQVDASGFLKVNIKAGAGSGGTAMADDAAFTPAVTNGTPAFGFADETAPDSVDEGDAGALRMTLDRKLLTRVVGATDANRLDIDASGHAQVDIAAASVPVPVTDNSGSLTVDNAALSVVGGGAEATALRVTMANDSTGVVSVDDNGGALTVDNAGTFAVQATIAAAATSIAKAEDAAHADNDVGAMVLAVRDDALNARSGADNDYEPLHTNADGALWTLDVNSAASAASLSVIDDWDESDRAKVNPIVGQAGVAAGAGAVAATVQRVTLASDDPAVAALQILDNIVAGSEAQVDIVAALPAGSNNIGDVDVLTMPVTEVVGDVAADAAVPANPLAIGGRASTAVPTAVSADGDSVYNWLNRLGMSVVSAIPGLGLNADPHTLLSETAQYTTTQTSTVLVAGGASERIIITSIQIQAGATTAATVQVYFGTGAYARGTDEAIFDGEFAPSATLKPGFVSSPPSGYRAGALGDDVLVTTSAGITLTVTIWYYILGV